MPENKAAHPGLAAEDDNPGASPTRIGDPRIRFEAARALTWGLVIGLIALVCSAASSAAGGSSEI